MPDADSPQLIVVDASVIVALVASSSTAADEMGERLRFASLHAPHLLAVEVDSALRGLVLGGLLTPAQADSARRMAHALPIELWPWEVQSDRAWELRSNLTTYDAGYVALSERLDATLLTADVAIARSGVATCPVEVMG